MDDKIFWYMMGHQSAERERQMSRPRQSQPSKPSAGLVVGLIFMFLFIWLGMSVSATLVIALFSSGSFGDSIIQGVIWGFILTFLLFSPALKHL